MRKSFAVSCLFFLLGLAGTANWVLADSSDYSGMKMRRLSGRTPTSVVTDPPIGSEVHTDGIVKEEIIRDEVLRPGTGTYENGGMTHEVRKENVTETVTETERFSKSVNETVSDEEMKRERATVLENDSVSENGMEAEANEPVSETADEAEDQILTDTEDGGAPFARESACVPYCENGGWNVPYRRCRLGNCCRNFEQNCCDPCMTQCCPCGQSDFCAPRCRFFRKHFWRTRCCSNWRPVSFCEPCCTESGAMTCVTSDSECTESEAINCVTSCDPCSVPCCETGTTCVTVRRHCGIFCRRALRQARWTMPYRTAYPAYSSYSGYSGYSNYGAWSNYGYGNSWAGSSWNSVGNTTYKTSDCGCGN